MHFELNSDAFKFQYRKEFQMTFVLVESYQNNQLRDLSVLLESESLFSLKALKAYSDDKLTLLIHVSTRNPERNYFHHALVHGFKIIAHSCFLEGRWVALVATFIGC